MAVDQDSIADEEHGASGTGFLSRIAGFQKIIALVAAILGIYATFQSTRNSTRLGDIETRLASLKEERIWAKELYTQFDAIVSKGADDQARVDRLAGLLALTELTDQPRVKSQLSLLIKQQAARYEAALTAKSSPNAPGVALQLQQYRQLQAAAGAAVEEAEPARARRARPAERRPLR